MNHPCDRRNCDSICALSIYAVARKTIKTENITHFKIAAAKKLLDVHRKHTTSYLLNKVHVSEKNTTIVEFILTNMICKTYPYEHDVAAVWLLR